MDIIDILWNTSQDRAIDSLTAEQQKILKRDGSSIKQLEKDNYELRLRLSLLIRLLIERGVFSADDFSTLLEETKDRLMTGADKPASKRPSGAPGKPKIQQPVGAKSARSGGKAPGHGPKTVVI